MTGDAEDEGTILTPLSTKWRVWDIKEDGTVVIISKYPLNQVSLRGTTGFVNAVDVLEGICDIYANEEMYGVSENDVRSMKIEDLEDTRVSSNIITLKEEYRKDSTSFPKYGETNIEFYGNSGYTSGNFYTEKNGLTVIDTPKVASEINPIEVTQTNYNILSTDEKIDWINIKNSSFPRATYGHLLEGGFFWLASPCVDCVESGVSFRIHTASIDGMVDSIYSEGLCDSVYFKGSSERGVCPMISLSPTLKIVGGDGKTFSTAWEIKQ